MPEYVYKCPSCKHKFSRVVAMEARHAVSCNQCGGEVSIVPQRVSSFWPRYANPHTERVSRADATEPSGLLEQSARDGW